MERAKIFNVTAKGKFSHSIDLFKLVSEVKKAIYNEGFKGGRVELPMRKAIEPLEFEVCESEDKIAKVELYHTGTYLIFVRNPNHIELVENALIELVENNSE